MIIMVSGTRKGVQEQLIRDQLSVYATPGNILLVGGARGVDEQARRIWHNDYQLSYIVMPAPWDRVGRAAGPMRNMAMLAGNIIAPYGLLIPDLLLAFPAPDSVGTKHAIRIAREHNIPVEVYT